MAYKNKKAKEPKKGKLLPDPVKKAVTEYEKKCKHNKKGTKK